MMKSVPPWRSAQKLASARGGVVDGRHDQVAVARTELQRPRGDLLELGADRGVRQHGALRTTGRAARVHLVEVVARRGDVLGRRVGARRAVQSSKLGQPSGAAASSAIQRATDVSSARSGVDRADQLAARQQQLRLGVVAGSCATPAAPGGS